MAVLLSSGRSHTTETVLGSNDLQLGSYRGLEIANKPKIKPVIPTNKQKIWTNGFRVKDNGEDERLWKILGAFDEGIFEFGVEK